MVNKCFNYYENIVIFCCILGIRHAQKNKGKKRKKKPLGSKTNLKGHHLKSEKSKRTTCSAV